jgi:hypothetical protein
VEKSGLVPITPRGSHFMAGDAKGLASMESTWLQIYKEKQNDVVIQNIQI